MVNSASSEWTYFCHCHLIKSRSSYYLQMFFKIGVLKNFTKFTKKHLCWSFFSLSPVPESLYCYKERDSSTLVFIWILQNTFYVEHLLYRTTPGDCFRSSPDVPIKRCSEHISKLTGEHPWQSAIWIKLQIAVNLLHISRTLWTPLKGCFCCF